MAVLRLLLLLCLFIISAGLLGCTSRAFVKPRSQIIEEAADDGTSLPTIEAERELFLSREDNQKYKLKALLRKRSQGGYRDLNYRLGPGDQLEINVFDVPELNLPTQVRQGGFVSLPLVGAVRAEGLTETEFSYELSRRLTQYVKNPQVTVVVTNYAGHKVSVMGAVMAPGSYPLKKGGNSLLEILGQAGGLSERAGNYLIFIPSELAGEGISDMRASYAFNNSRRDVKSSGIEIYLDDIMGLSGGLPIDVPVTGGDTVLIPESGKVMVDGEVQKPGQYELGRQTSLLGALASAGGINYSAKVDEVEISRDFGSDQKIHLVVNLEKIGNGEERDIRLRNGDIVRVPSDAAKRMKQDTYESIRNLINFGVGGNVNVVK